MDDAAVAPTSSARDDGRPVVDRVLAGRVRYDSGQDTVRPHGTDDWLVALTIEGLGQVRAAGRPPILLPVGTVLAFRPGTPQRYGAAEGAASWEVLWAHVDPRPEWLPLLEWPESAPGIGVLPLSPPNRARVGDALLAAVRHHRAGLRHATGFTMNALERALLWCATENDPAERDPAVAVVVEHVVARLDRPHTVASLARVAGISPSHLAHLFRRRLGVPVMAWVERMRMDSARDLLAHTDLSVAQVAARLGYADPLYFSRRFRHVEGLPPTAFRATCLHPSVGEATPPAAPGVTARSGS